MCKSNKNYKMSIYHRDIEIDMYNKFKLDMAISAAKTEYISKNLNGLFINFNNDEFIASLKDNDPIKKILLMIKNK